MTQLSSVAEGVSTRASAYYVWQAPSQVLAVHLKLDVVERMEREVLTSFKAVTQRGSEIGGLLLGKLPADRPVVVVEDYLGVSCDYARGPLYLLAAEDKARLAASIRRMQTDGQNGLRVVGFFRSNTRRELALDEDDLALMKEYFAESRQVCLLVKPFSMKPSLGGFFVWETGRIKGDACGLQFPFKRSELMKDEYAQTILAGESAAATGSVPTDGAAAAKFELRVTGPPAPAPAAARGEVRVSIPLVISKPEARPSAPPAPVKREAAAPPPPPPAPATKAEPRAVITPVLAKREAPAPAVVKPEAHAPVAPAVRAWAALAPPLVAKTQPAVTPVVARPELAPSAKPESGPAISKPEVEAPPPKPPTRSAFTSLGLGRAEPQPSRDARSAAPAAQARTPAVTEPPKREQAPPKSAQAPAPQTRAEAVAVPPKRDEAPAKPAAAAAPPVAARREEPASPAAAKVGEAAAAAPGAEGGRRKLPYAVAALAGVIVIATAGVLFLRPGAGKGARPSAAPDPASLALRVERNAGQLLLSWNREANAIRSAQTAVLSIFDGDHKEDVKLEMGQLRSGSIVYSPITNDVSFKLEVSDGKGQPTSETVRVIAGRPSPAAPPGAAAPARTETATPEVRGQPGTAPAQTDATAADGSQAAEPTPGGGAEPPAATKPAPVQFRTESLAARLSPPASLPEPPGLDTLSRAAPVRVADTSNVPPPPAQEGSGVTPGPSQPLRVGGNVQQALVVRQVTPTYPPLARQARVSGVVRVEATIGRDGRIVKAQAISGPPLLRQAAQDAVRQWIYRPTTLNGQAVEVVTQVDVTFNLSR